MLRLTFDDIRYFDPLQIGSKYEIKRSVLKEEDRQGRKYMIANEKFLNWFYQICSIVPISIMLGLLFFMLWDFSPQT